MTKRTLSRESRLATRPTGIPTAAHFTLVAATRPPLPVVQARVENISLSVDPPLRRRMNEGESYVPPFTLGQALQISEVVTSRSGWREADFPSLRGDGRSSP